MKLKGLSGYFTYIVFTALLVLYAVFAPTFRNDMLKRPLFEKLGYTPHGKFYKIILGEFRWFVGEYLSFKSIIYYGDKVDFIRKRQFRKIEYYNLYRTIETSILLNPYNEDAYYFAQATFSWDVGHVKATNRLLKYVMKYRTWDFKVPFFLGFNYAYFLKDYKKAAYYYKIASEISGSSLFTNLAARYFYEGGQTALAINYLKTMIKITRKKSIKKVYEIRLKALEGIYEIERAVKAFRQKFHRNPKDIKVLLKYGFLKKIPKDPYGGIYYIDKDGRVKTTSNFVFKKQKEKKWH
ncbi:hypothetical protein [Hippea maritima]|uniref:Uncharacterized protein n=1 Tax=Hippea maritima (strain ATCC 700847 / DSM 10411 / MH2) TaxID=760142 RepID=F2LVB7_HIPMA|nr:hypothetical protein [Hippea maritima]AEA33701.1 hypothetical protein Hipma_0731 [Hippea maritima DSM 10411]